MLSRKTRTSTDRAGILALPSLKRLQAAGEDAARPPAIGTVIQSKIDAWRGSVIVRMKRVALAQALATDAAKERISAVAADPILQQVVQPVRPKQLNGAVLQSNSPRAAGLWAVPKPASPKAHLCAKRRRTLPSPRANAPRPQHRVSLQDPLRQELTVLIARLHAVPAHGTTVPDSTTEATDPGASAGWPHPSWLQRPKPSRSDWSCAKPTAATQPERRWQQTGCDR